MAKGRNRVRKEGRAVLVGGVMERPSTLNNSRPPVSHGVPTQTHTHTHKTHRCTSDSVPITFPICVGLPALSPRATAGRGTSGRHVVWNRTTPSCRALPTTSTPPFSSSPSAPTQPAYPLQHLQRSAGLWRTALRASPITRRSGQAAGVTAHMSQHDRGLAAMRVH